MNRWPSSRIRPSLAVQLVRLTELRLAALEARAEADLALGREAAIVGDLESLVNANPYRQRFRAQLMLALYRACWEAEALAVYADTRRLLVDELGIEPGEQLRELHGAALVEDPGLRPAGAGLERIGRDWPAGGDAAGNAAAARLAAAGAAVRGRAGGGGCSGRDAEPRESQTRPPGRP